MKSFEERVAQWLGVRCNTHSVFLRYRTQDEQTTNPYGESTLIPVLTIWKNGNTNMIRILLLIS